MSASTPPANPPAEPAKANGAATGLLESSPSSLLDTVRRAWACLEPRTRRQLLISVMIGSLLAALDGFAVALLPTLFDRFGGDAGQSLGGLPTVAIGGIIGAMFIAKSLAGVLLIRWQFDFLTRAEGERAVELFDLIINRPYDQAFEVDSNDLIRDILVSLPQLYRGAAAGLALILIDLLGLAVLVVVLTAQSPLVGALLVILAVVMIAIYTRLIRGPAIEVGEAFQEGNVAILSHLREGLDGLKTVKAFAAEPEIVDRFARVRRPFSQVMRDLSFYQQISRYYLETTLIVVLGACIGIVTLVEGEAAVIATVSILAGVAARAMPALTRLLASMTAVRIAGPAVESIEDDLAQIASGRPKPEPTRKTGEAGPGGSISLQGVSFHYPGAASPAFSDKSLRVEIGELVTIAGGSGAGKTTLVDVLVGLLAPTAGVVRYPSARSIGYVAQETFVWNAGIRFNVTLGRPPVTGDEEAEIWNALEAAHLTTWARSLTDLLDTPLGERGGKMSGGQRQRLGIARAMFGRPAFLILDEPTSALDARTAQSILETLTELKSTVGILVVSHDPLVLGYGDRSIELDN